MCNISRCVEHIGNSLKCGKVVFFVGTGISNDYPSNIPLADDVTNNVLYLLCYENASLQKLVFKNENPTEKDIPDGIIKIFQDIRKNIKGELGDGYYKKYGYDKWEKKESIRMEVLLQFVWNVVKKEVLRILEPFNESVPNKYHYFLAKALECGNDIITTNYDGLIENACQEMNVIPKGFYYSEETFGEWLKDKKSGCLFKIHGTLQDLDKNDKGESVIATLSEISSGLSENKRKVLLGLLDKKIVIFMGYSFSDYFDISPVLKESIGKEMIYYADYKPEMTNLECNLVPVGDSENYYFNYRQFLRIRGTTSILRDKIIKYLSWSSYFKDHRGLTNISKNSYLNKIKSLIFSLQTADKAHIIAQVFTNLGLCKKAVKILDNISYDNDPLKQSFLFVDCASAYSACGKTTKSLKFLSKSLKILDECKKKSYDCYLSYCMTLVNIGRDRRRRWEFGKATTYYQNVIKMLSHLTFRLDKSKNAEVLKLQLLAYDYMGDVSKTIGEQIFAQLNLKSLVIYYFRKAEKIYQVRKKIEEELANIGVKSRHFDGEELHRRHIKTIRQFLYDEKTDIEPTERYTEIENLVGRIAGLADTSHILLANGAISEAETQLIEAKIIAGNICSPWDKVKLALQLGILYEKYGKNYSKSKKYYKESYDALSGLERCRFTLCMKIYLVWKIKLNVIKEIAQQARKIKKT